MKQIRRLRVLLLAMVLILTILPLSVSANSPGIPPWYEFKLSNLPEGTVYVDLLIYLPETDAQYVNFMEENLPDGWSQYSPIVSYCEADYRSYTFHYRNASSYIYVRNTNSVRFFDNAPWSSTDEGVRYDHADEIAARGDIKLAMLDKDGNILKISPRLSLKPREFMSYLAGTFHYDAATDAYEAKTYTSGFGMVLYPFFVVLGIIFTCATEGLIAKLYGLRQQYRILIRWTNVVSQLMMHLSYVLFYSLVFWKYSCATIALEFFVYVGEYLFYRWRMKNVTRKKCLAFTLTANTVSLVLGLLLITFAM